MTVIDARVPTRAPGLEFLGELRDSGYAQPPSAVRRANGQMIQLTPLLYCLLEAVDGRRDAVGLAEEVSRAYGKTVSADDVEYLLDKKLAPLGLLCDDDGTAPPVEKPVPLLALRWKVVVTNPSVTRRVTAPFAVLFRPWIVVPVLAAFAVTAWWVLFRHGLASGTRQAFDKPELLLGAFGLILVSAGWHEFGHAAACRAAGATPGATGAGLYMVWPAFYTDVEDSRRLGRGGRLTVDLGGLYFNALAAVAVLAVWMPTRADALLLVVAAQLLLMLRQLAPVIRADGYHILSDLIGVPDLFQHVKPTLAGLLPWNWGKPQPLRPLARWVVRLWVLLVMPLILWMLLVAVLLLPRLVATAWNGVSQQGEAFFSSDGNVLAMAAALLKTASLVVPVAATVYMVVRVARRTLTKVWTRTEGRPAARALATAALVLLVAFLGVSWWPQGQYKPVSADERGTLTNLLHMRSAGATLEAVEPIAGVTPVSGYALVPRDSDAATILLVPGPDGALQGIVTEGDRAGIRFPFTLPDSPAPGDNQALAVNTGTGKVVYDVAVALVWVTDGAPADQRNEAYALANCTNCTTVAVAFQLVLIVGQSDVVTPVNLAVAINSGCVSCQTAALAVQLVVTLNELPDDELRAQINEALARLDGAPMDAMYEEVQAVRQEIMTLLADAGLVAADPVSLQADTTNTTATTAVPAADGPTTAESTTTSTSTPGSTTTTTDASTTTTTAATGG